MALRRLSRVYTANSCPGTTSAAHTYGRRIMDAEAFTSSDAEKWQSHPGTIKILGDWAFCEGINRFVFHRYAAQPWTNVAPGMAMGPWGLHYERTQTWWEQSKAWHEYIARCQYLLQQGLFVADACYLQPEGSPRRFNEPASAMIATDIRGGYNFDGCSPEVVMTRMKVVERTDRPARRHELPRAGAAGNRNDDARPAPQNQGAVRQRRGHYRWPATRPRSRRAWRKWPPAMPRSRSLAGELWPKLVTGKTAAAMFERTRGSAGFLRHPQTALHPPDYRRSEVYFVANPEPKAVEAVATFRMAGKKAGTVVARDGTHGTSGVFNGAAVTQMPIQLGAAGSVFVVFANGKVDDPEVSLPSNATDRNW